VRGERPVANSWLRHCSSITGSLMERTKLRSMQSLTNLSRS